MNTVLCSCECVGISYKMGLFGLEVDQQKTLGQTGSEAWTKEEAVAVLREQVATAFLGVSHAVGGDGSNI